MRLNHPVDCDGCKMQVNPYVIDNPPDRLMTVECPNCGKIFRIVDKINVEYKIDTKPT